MSGDFDLFGNPVEVLSKLRGRPKHEASAEIENKIKMLLALGWSNQRIAAAVGLSLPTLRKNYFQVLKLRECQRDRMNLARAMKLWELGTAGNVAALKAFAQMLERNDLEVLSTRIRDDQPEEVEEDRSKLGKKVRAQLEAEDVANGNSSWGDDLVFRTPVQ
ncbi:AraC family transcriptional regulator [Microvirga tunisiensis]|uniref:AraC family transcriptional regulator n=1 Tax=Pannonibacter tanglangensis TaxID=2750084 RepID=A0A7X5J8G7_9HYPH|nr:AraC family transcriptional regulator [Pannonibacter sp. XCT-53]NBN78689.1 AraC family transcriptional regulator [Pannonibacter sp. XCT-53]